MKINQILKQLTPERVKKELEKTNKIKLSKEIQGIANEYREMGDPARNEYLWKWILRGTKIFTGRRVNKKYLPFLLEAKLLLFILDTFFDDIVDKYKIRNKKLLDEILKVPFYRDYIEFGRLTKEEKKCIRFAIKIWKNVMKIIKRFPRYKEFRDIFEYDVSQFLNALKYSYLVHQNNYLLNKKENWLYLPHSMQVILNVTLELMCMPKFNFRELGLVRKMAWCAQNMSRIGNWISTWEREIPEQDFTSAVLVYVLDKGNIDVSDLQKGDKAKIILEINEAKIEKILLREWEENYNELKELAPKIKSFNVGQKISALEKIIFFHLSSRGYK